MNNYSNWRFWVLALLFSIGICSTAIMFGDPSPAMTDAQWLCRFAISAAMAMLCFGSIFALSRKWNFFNQSHK